MNYKHIYDVLIQKRQHEPATGYTENHHILMRSMGGTDDKDNLVQLTGREHWIAHLLLHKIHKNSKTVYACHMMAMRCEERGIPQIKTSRAYEHIRKEHAKIVSTNMKKAQSGKNNSQYGTMWICNIDLKINKKIPKDSDIPEGWVKGTNKWKRKKCSCGDLIFTKSKMCEKCRKEHQEKTIKKKTEDAYAVYTDFIGKNTTLQDYANKYFTSSYVALHLMFKRCIKEYKLTQGIKKNKGAKH